MPKYKLNLQQFGSNYSERVFEDIKHINEYGQLYCSPKISADEGWSLFYPGNGIKPGEGGSYQPMETLRCNSTVSRIKTGDPLKDNEGINTNTLLLKKRETLMRTEV
jgi:hypothetical protein